MTASPTRSISCAIPAANILDGTFADPVSAMIGHEAALHYAQEGNHYETRCVLTIACRRTSAVETRLGGTFISGAGGADREREREWFKQQLQEFVDAISPVWKLTPLDLSALLSHITSCINGRMCQVKAPAASGPARRGAGQSGLRPGLQTARRRTAHPRGLARRAFRLSRMRSWHCSWRNCRFRIAIRSARFRWDSALRSVSSACFGATGSRSAKARGRCSAKASVRVPAPPSKISTRSRWPADADDAIAEAEGGEVRFCYATPKIVLTGETAAEAEEARSWSSRSVRTWASIRASRPLTPTRPGSARFRSTAGTTSASRWSVPATWSTSCR